MKDYILLLILGFLNVTTLSFENINQSKVKFHRIDKYRSEGSNIANLKYNVKETNANAEKVTRKKRHAIPSKSTINKR